MPTSTAATKEKIHVSREICFSDSNGRIKEGIRKKKLKLLTPFANLLRHTMQPGEEILHVMTATSPMSAIEQLTTGWVIFYIKRCVLIVTNKRILHIPTTAGYKPRRSFSQINLGDIERFKVRSVINSGFSLTYKNGKKDIFNYIKRADAKKLKALLMTPEPGQVQTRAQGRIFVCPRCNEPLQKDQYACRGCRLQFKTPGKALKLSVLVPGGGYFYTEHPILGVLDFITEAILIVMTLFSLISSLVGPPEWEAVFMFGTALVLEKLITLYHAKHYVKEYMPADKDFVPFVSPRMA